MKGQGALEYLLILAGVLAIAVVVLLVAHQAAAPAQHSALINQDRYSCAQEGIELVGYNELPSKDQILTIKYNGKTYECWYNGKYSGPELPSSSTTMYKLSNTPIVKCNIHMEDGKQVELGLVKGGYMRSQFERTTCRNETVCYFGDLDSIKFGCTESQGSNALE